MAGYDDDPTPDANAFTGDCDMYVSGNWIGTTTGPWVLTLRSDWPEVVYEDILDAEVIDG